MGRSGRSAQGLHLPSMLSVRSRLSQPTPLSSTATQRGRSSVHIQIRADARCASRFTSASCRQSHHSMLNINRFWLRMHVCLYSTTPFPRHLPGFTAKVRSVGGSGRAARSSRLSMSRAASAMPLLLLAPFPSRAASTGSRTVWFGCSGRGGVGGGSSCLSCARRTVALWTLGVRAVHRALSSLRPMFAHTSSHATPWS